LGELLKGRFGEHVKAEYIDVYSEGMSSHPSAIQVLNSGNVPLPLVSINGVPTFAGGVSFPVIAAKLEELGLVPVSATNADQC